MPQTWTDNCFDTSHEWDTNLAAMEANHAASKSNFSGSSAPTSPVVGQPWSDTGGETHKRRDFADTGWMADLHADADFKIPVYRNDTCEGWLIDSSVTDRVVALKGGSGAYSANGGTTAGTAWATFASHVHTMTHTHSHNHQWFNYTSSSATDQSYNISGTIQNLPDVSATKSGFDRGIVPVGGSQDFLDDSYTSNDATASSATNTSAGPSEPRMAAAIHTLQYPDLT